MISKFHQIGVAQIGNRRLSYVKGTLDVDVVVFHDEVIVFDFVVVVRPIVFFRDISSELVLEVLATMEAAFQLVKARIGLVIDLLVDLVFGDAFAIDQA